MVLICSSVAMGATFGFAESAAANLRERDDMWNPTIAGFLAGSVAGLRSMSACWLLHGKIKSLTMDSEKLSNDGRLWRRISCLARCIQLLWRFPAGPSQRPQYG